MRIRVSVYIFCVTCIALTVLLLWLRFKPATLESATPTNDGESLAAAVGRNGSKVKNRRPGVTDSSRRLPESANVPQQPAKTKGEEMKDALAMFNDEEVVLYGRVIDQFGNPVAGANVGGDIQVNNGTRVGKDVISASTDANGLFQISGYRGKALGVNVTKKGYVMATIATRFVYSHLWPETERYTPDPNNPAIFRMWKLQGAERLTPINERYKLAFSDKPISFDLLTGKAVSNGGDLSVRLTRSAGDVSERTLQEWSVEIAAIEGGLIESTPEASRIAFELPEGGYQPSYLYTMSTNTQSWHGAFNQIFYLHSRNGQISGKINIGISINQQPSDPVWIEFHGEVNPSGSPNFEADAVPSIGQ